MLRHCVVAVALAVCTWACSPVYSQTPEITVTARSPQALAEVLDAFGDRGEIFGFTGPKAFLNSYSRFLDNQQPLTAALTITSKSPMFATQFVVTDAAAFFSALSQDGVQWDRQSGQLTKANSSLRFYVHQNGQTLRISDNADFLKSLRWPTADTFSASNIKAIARVDWRNLQPEARNSVATQALMVFLPQANTLAPFSLDALPDLLSIAASTRLAAMFDKSETITFQFAQADQGSLQVTADVLNRLLIGRPSDQSPFAASDNESIATFQWNLPVEAEFRKFVGVWSAQLSNSANQLFAGDEIADKSGLKILHEGAAILARHAQETIALPNLQGAISAVVNGDQPIVVAGIRVANAARLDNELQKLIKAAIDNGAPFQFQANVASGDDLSMHRLQLPVASELSAVKALFGDTLTIHLATTSHALLVGVGTGGDKAIQQLVSPSVSPNNHWLDINVTHENREATTRLGLQPCQLQVLPANQGFQIIARLTQPKGPAQLTSTRSEASSQ